MMTIDFVEMTEPELISEYGSAREKADGERMSALQAEAVRRINAYLSGEIDVNETDSPLFFGFIRTFSKTDDADLNLLAKKAEAKITPLLKQFDQSAGYENVLKISAEEIEQNIHLLDKFERIDPFEVDVSSNELMYLQFKQVLKVIDAVDVTDGDDPASEEAAEAFKETVVESAKLKTYMRLCVHPGTITMPLYLGTLQFEMEKALVVLFVMEQAPKLASFDLDNIENVRREFQKLIDMLD